MGASLLFHQVLVDHLSMQAFKASLHLAMVAAKVCF